MRRWMVAVLVLIAAVGVGGVLGHKYWSTAATTTTTTTSTTTSTTLAPTTTTTGSTTTTSTATVAACTPSQVTITALTGSGAAGTIQQPFQIANSGATSCTLSGWVTTLQWYGANGSALPTITAKVHSDFFIGAANQPPTTLTLAQGSVAQFAIRYNDVPTGNAQSCPSAAFLGVWLPQATTPIRVSAAAQPCGGGLTAVSPFYLP